MSNFWQVNCAQWIEGCMVLSDEQELAYFRILNWTHMTDQPPPHTDKVMASILKSQPRRARRLVDELVGKGKLFIAAGRIHNKRADEEISIREKRKKKTENLTGGSRKHPPNGQILPEVDRLSDVSDLFSPSNPLKTKDPNSTHLAYNIREDIESKKNPPHPPKGNENEFEEFWKVFPKRDGPNPKKTAQEKFTLAVRKGVDPQLILEGAQVYRRWCSLKGIVGTEKVVMALTWINQARWTDDYAAGSEQSEQAAALRALEEHEAHRRHQ